MDRIDIHIDVPAVKIKELTGEAQGESSQVISERVVRARRTQLERFRSEKIYCNAKMSPRLIRKYCEIDQQSKAMLENSITRLGLSARDYDRILKVSRGQKRAGPICSLLNQSLFCFSGGSIR